MGCKNSQLNSKKYILPLTDQDGHSVDFEANGIEQISTKINLNMKDDFSSTVLDAKRPKGEIEVLIGFDHAAQHPVREKSMENLVLLRNRFGVCASGSYPSLVENTAVMSMHMQVCAISPASLEDFFTTESLGTQCTPKCGPCKCGKCPPGGKDYTFREERELKLT